MTMENKPDLMPCPIDGGEIEHHTYSGFHYGSLGGYKEKSEDFTCKKCGLKLCVRGDEITKEQAFAIWNTRAPAERDGADVEALKSRFRHGHGHFTRNEMYRCFEAIDYMHRQGYLQPQPRVEGLSEWHDFASKISDMLWGGELGWTRTGLKGMLAVLKERLAPQSGDDAKAEERAFELLDRIEIQCKAVGHPVGGIDELKALFAGKHRLSAPVKPDTAKDAKE